MNPYNIILNRFIVGSILQIEPKRLCSGYKPEPAVGTTGTYPFLKRMCSCYPIVFKTLRPLRLCGEL